MYTYVYTVFRRWSANKIHSQVVAGKFLAAEFFFCLIWMTLLFHVLILVILGKPDLGPVVAVYIGITTLGAAMIGLGLLASALTRNQIIAVIVAFIGNLLVLLFESLRRLFADDPEAGRFFDFVGLSSHFRNEYHRGVVDLRFIALYLSVALLRCLNDFRRLDSVGGKGFFDQNVVPLLDGGEERSGVGILISRQNGGIYLGAPQQLAIVGREKVSI